MRRGLRATAAMGRPVCFRDIRLGVVVDLLLDEPCRRVVGLDVLCGDRAHRFLPLAACEAQGDVAAVPSALVLMTQELDFYRERCRSLTSVRHFPVRQGEEEIGTLADFEFAPADDLVELLVENEDGALAVPVEESIVLGPDALRPAV